MADAKIISYLDSLKLANAEDIKAVLAVVEEEHNQLVARLDQYERDLFKLGEHIERLERQVGIGWAHSATTGGAK